MEWGRITEEIGNQDNWKEYFLQHLQGVEAHHDVSDLPYGKDLQLEEVKSDEGTLRDGSSENTAKCELLVDRRLTKKIVGYTHEDIDSKFGSTSTPLRSTARTSNLLYPILRLLLINIPI